MRNLLQILISILIVLPTVAVNREDRPRDSVDSSMNDSPVPLIHLGVKQLPDLNIPRALHQVFMANGEYVVAGGHTNGFIPTPTAEYFKDGEWHVMQMVYNHDFGFSVVLKSGKVLLAGGCSEPIGIGQTFLAEMYDPESHTFNGFSNMDQKRTGASGLELDSGCVVIAGNWYHNDGIELFDGKKRFTYVKDVVDERSGPFIFRTAKDNAIIFSGYGTKGDTLRSSMADRLKGEPVNIPLFEKWHPSCCTIHRSAESFIGDASKGIYAYLLPVIDSTGQAAIAKIENGDVTLLPTACPVPMKTQWGGIEYSFTIITDQERGRAYLMGTNADLHTQPEKGFRHYVLRIDYAEAAKGRPAPLTLYYTDPMQDGPDYTPILTPEGNLLIAGGLTTELSNFYPSQRAFLLLVGEGSGEKLQSSSNLDRYWWLLSILALTGICLITAVMFKQRHKTRPTVPSDTHHADDKTAIEDDLMLRILNYMENEKPYLNSNLKVSDIAGALLTNRRYISDCINDKRHCTFNQFINSYRIEYAKKQLLSNPDKKLSTLCEESGFSNETSFFRTFKTFTGMTPKEWVAKNKL